MDDKFYWGRKWYILICFIERGISFPGLKFRVEFFSILSSIDIYLFESCRTNLSHILYYTIFFFRNHKNSEIHWKQNFRDFPRKNRLFFPFSSERFKSNAYDKSWWNIKKTAEKKSGKVVRLWACVNMTCQVWFNGWLHRQSTCHKPVWWRNHPVWYSDFITHADKYIRQQRRNKLFLDDAKREIDGSPLFSSHVELNGRERFQIGGRREGGEV